MSHREQLTTANEAFVAGMANGLLQFIGREALNDNKEFKQSGGSTLRETRRVFEGSKLFNGAIIRLDENNGESLINEKGELNKNANGRIVISHEGKDNTPYIIFEFQNGEFADALTGFFEGIPPQRMQRSGENITDPRYEKGTMKKLKEVNDAITAMHSKPLTKIL